MKRKDDSEALIDSLERKVHEAKGLDRARALRELAWAQYDSRQYRDSLDSFEEAFDVFQTEGGTADAAECYRAKAVVLADLGRFYEATELIDEALEMFRHEVDTVGVARCELLLGDVLLQGLSSPDRAIRVLQSSRDVFSAHDMDADFGFCTLRIGQACRELGDFDRALDEWRLAEKFLEKSSCYQYQADSLNSGAELLFRLRRYEESIFWFKKAKGTYESSGYNGNAMICDDRIAEARLILFG